MTGIFRYIIAMSIFSVPLWGMLVNCRFRFGLQLHLAADQISGLSDGQAISSWSDLSGKGRHAVQAAESARPVYKPHVLNDFPVVRFDGINDYLTVPESHGNTNSLSCFQRRRECNSQQSQYSGAFQRHLFSSRLAQANLV
jgi:hypothetical protein